MSSPKILFDPEIVFCFLFVIQAYLRSLKVMGVMVPSYEERMRSSMHCVTVDSILLFLLKVVLFPLRFHSFDHFGP